MIFISFTRQNHKHFSFYEHVFENYICNITSTIQLQPSLPQRNQLTASHPCSPPTGCCPSAASRQCPIPCLKARSNRQQAPIPCLKSPEQQAASPHPLHKSTPKRQQIPNSLNKASCGPVPHSPAPLPEQQPGGSILSRKADYPDYEHTACIIAHLPHGLAHGAHHRLTSGLTSGLTDA